MSELRSMIIDAAVEFATCEGMVDELEAILDWNDETDIGLYRALKLARGEAADALERLTGLVRILMNQEGHNV